MTNQTPGTLIRMEEIIWTFSNSLCEFFGVEETIWGWHTNVKKVVVSKLFNGNKLILKVFFFW